MHGCLLLSLSHCLATETDWVYEQEAWNDVSFVGLQLESVFHQLIGSVVARLCTGLFDI